MGNPNANAQAKRFRRRQCVFLRISYCTIRNNVVLTAVQPGTNAPGPGGGGWRGGGFFAGEGVKVSLTRKHVLREVTPAAARRQGITFSRLLRSPELDDRERCIKQRFGDVSIQHRRLLSLQGYRSAAFHRGGRTCLIRRVGTSPQESSQALPKSKQRGIAPVAG
jgi:hypothetical protein